MLGLETTLIDSKARGSKNVCGQAENIGIFSGKQLYIGYYIPYF